MPGWPARSPDLAGLSFVLVTAPLITFLVITWQVVAQGPLLRLDERLGRAVVHPDRVSGVLADLGDIAVAVPVLAVALVWAAWRARRADADRWWLPSAAAAVLMAGLPALIVPLKDAIARPGPPVMGPVTGFYPSGHTATAAIAYGAAALVLLPWLRTPQARRGLLVVCLVLNLVVAYGLVRHGYHWPLDVLASWCLCGVLLSSLRLFLSRSSRRTSSGTPSRRTGPS
ncbi:phosphatase PAP2 family protein [Streptomyces sp. TP-A0356]|uniref:phosphatase PAP2 family protein n=1 Tax=Streptomyces sp. TP-A0356 TaxID=1359208 RepID=UPI000A8AF871|nr:phosphatase PAP2 family protein [Streptomyces sp. TP-A0356]